MMNWINKNWGWITVVIIGLLPLIKIMSMIHIDFSASAESWISMDTFTMPGRQPGELPREVSGAHLAVKETGEWAIRWMVIVLSMTPFSILTRIKPSLWVRQAAGITAFAYAAVHFMFFCIDRGLMETFIEVGYILGLIATLVMMVLAITSNRRSMKYLRNAWKKLHRLAYFAAILAILHVALLKHGEWVPYLIILAIGFLLRLNFVKKEISKFRTRKNPKAVLG